jgi:hypothetical protein
MKVYAHLWYIVEFFLEWEMFQTKVVEKLKTHILCAVIFFREFCRLWDDVKKHGRTRIATDNTIIRRIKDGICMLDN